jgi:hypothetical protein
MTPSQEFGPPGASPRAQAVHAVLARASKTGAAVYGFSSDKASCEQLRKRGVPDEWGFMCVEGDAVWTRVPREEVVEAGERKGAA